jgi:hypothetical protein
MPGVAISATVIVEPDSISAWIGLAGVVVGVLLAGALDLWRSHLAEVKARKRELRHAIDDLRASASALRMATDFRRDLPNAGRWSPAWYQALAPAVERLARSATVVMRSGPTSLGQAANELDLAVRAYAAHPNDESREQIMARSIAFSTEARRHRL